MAQDYGFGINGNGRALSFDDYKKLSSAYYQFMQANNPDAQNMVWGGRDIGPEPAPSKLTPEAAAELENRFWSQYKPEVRADFSRHSADSKDWTDTVGGVLKYAIPLAVGGAGLAATGLLGPAAQGFVGGAPLSSTAAAGAGAAAGDAALADLAGGLIPEYGTEAAYTAGLGDTAGWASAPSLGGVTDPGYAVGPWEGPSMPGPANGTNIPTGAEAGAGTASGKGLLDAAGNIDWGKALETAGSLLNSNDSAGSGMGGGGGGGLLGYRPYTPPAAPVRAPFKPSTGLADFARALQVARTPKGLMSF